MSQGDEGVAETPIVSNGLNLLYFKKMWLPRCGFNSTGN